MPGLVLVLWAVYLSECFVRSTPGCWVFRPGSPRRFVGVSEPDLTLLGGRFDLVWTSIAPWALAYRIPPPHDALVNTQEPMRRMARDTRTLRWLATILFALVMVVFPLLVWMERFVPWLPVFGAAVVAAWACTLGAYFSTHKRVFGRLPPIESSVIATLSPLTLMRAPVSISIDASTSTHPVYAADVLCGDEEFLRIARIWHHDEPEVRKAVERLAAKRGRKIDAPPAHHEDDVSVYCPRCHATYLLSAVTCSDCRGVRVLPLPNARRSHAAELAQPVPQSTPCR